MRVLISNDDGVYAKGINQLYKSLITEADHIDVIAPDRNRSGASNSLSLSRPLRVKKISKGFLSVEGTPTDCVHLGITGLLDIKPDIVISGINAGSNLGDDVLYSGTVAAAMEGRFLGLPAIAISLAGKNLKYYTTAGRIAIDIFSKVKEAPLPAGTILNINVPDMPYNSLKGFQVTRLGTRHCAEPTIKQFDPRGLPIYWVGPAGTEEDAGPGTDFHAVNNNYVSITPLHVDLTHYASFENLSKWVTKLKTSSS